MGQRLPAYLFLHSANEIQDITNYNPVFSCGKERIFL